LKVAPGEGEGGAEEGAEGEGGEIVEKEKESLGKGVLQHTGREVFLHPAP